MRGVRIRAPLEVTRHADGADDAAHDVRLGAIRVERPLPAGVGALRADLVID